MPKIRSIHYDAWKSRKLARCSDGAERLYWRLQPHADDEGRFEDDARVVWGSVGITIEHWNPDVVTMLLTELTAVGLLDHYEVDGIRYFQVTSFGAYQKPKYRTKSKLPGPDVGTIVPPSPPDGLSSSGSRLIDHIEPPSGGDRTPIEPASNPRSGEERSGVGDGEEFSLKSTVTQTGPTSDAAERESTKLRQAVGIVARRRNVTETAATKDSPGAWQQAARAGIRSELIDAALDQGEPGTAEAWADLLDIDDVVLVPSWRPDPACGVCEGVPWIEGPDGMARCPECYPAELGDPVLPKSKNAA